MAVSALAHSWNLGHDAPHPERTPADSGSHPMMLRTTSLLALAAVAAAQSPSLVPGKPGPAARAVAVANAPASGPVFMGPIVDRAEDGRLWVAGPSYKACFRPQGVQFQPFFGSDLPSNVTLDLTLESVRLAGAELQLGAAAPKQQDQAVVYDRGSWCEGYRLATTGIEQVFTFAELPQRGDLAFTVHVATNLRGRLAADGLEFVHERGAVRYSGAVAIDAKGRRLALPTTLDGDRIHFAVPAAFVAAAALPLVVDPVVGTTYFGPTPGYQITGKDLAYDDSANEWQVAWSYPFSQTDTDLVVQRFDAAFQPVGGAFAIDLTNDSWFDPAIANLALYDKFLVVAHKVTGGASRVAGRVTQAGSSTPLTGQFEIEGPGVTGNLGRPALHPDVGGDTSAAAPTYWTVVFESRNGGDGDIYARQVTDAGVLRGAAPIAIAATGVDEIQPRIAKSSGRGAFQSQAWGIVYNHNFWQIHGRSLTWNGALIGPSQLLFSGIDNLTRFDVSSPTDDQNGQRQMLLTFEYAVSQQSGMDVCGVLVDRTMTPNALPISLSALALSAPTNSLAQDQPSVDCDGRRFVVAYRHEFAPLDHDVYAGVFQPMAGVQGGLRAVQTDILAQSFDEEGRAVVCSRAAGGGGRLVYGMLWQRAVTASTDRLEACSYEGRQDGSQVAVRSTGCGGLGISTTGASLAGESLALQIGNGSGLLGFVVGFPAQAAVPGCPGCVQGVQGNVVIGNQYALTMPLNGAFVGLTLSFQGFAIGTGPCLAQVSLSDTVDATIR